MGILVGQSKWPWISISSFPTPTTPAIQPQHPQHYIANTTESRFQPRIFHACHSSPASNSCFLKNKGNIAIYRCHTITEEKIALNKVKKLEHFCLIPYKMNHSISTSASRRSPIFTEVHCLNTSWWDPKVARDWAWALATFSQISSPKFYIMCYLSPSTYLHLKMTDGWQFVCGLASALRKLEGQWVHRSGRRVRNSERPIFAVTALRGFPGLSHTRKRVKSTP